MCTALACAPSAFAAKKVKAKEATAAAVQARDAALSQRTGGSAFNLPPDHPTVAGTQAKLVDGVAYAPADAPAQVQAAIWAGNEIQGLPYRYGGGHASFNDTAYDCSGTVSYALHGGGLVKSPLDSSDFMKWGKSGPGQWITVYTNPGHVYTVIAGLRLDTSSVNDSGGSGPLWRKAQRPSAGFRVRHFEGL